MRPCGVAHAGLLEQGARLKDRMQVPIWSLENAAVSQKEPPP